MNKIAAIPMRVVGPLNIMGQMVKVPLATLEKPLWPSVSRGAKVSRLSSCGIKATILNDCMTRSIVLEAPDASYACNVKQNLQLASLQEIAKKTSQHLSLENYHLEIVANLLYIRFSFTTGEAAGHNMTTKAADNLAAWFLEQYRELKYVSVSANYCVDKKVSAINGILGRGKSVVAELEISHKICQEILHTTAEKIVNLNIKKNLLGSLINGGVRSANAHFANMLLAFYLATGQDAANIVEGSQGIVHTEVRSYGIYFSVTVPNIIVGIKGSGKDLPYVKENLALLGCKNSRELAIVAAATVLCGELSLLAAQSNQGELMRSHLKMERQ